MNLSPFAQQRALMYLSKENDFYIDDCLQECGSRKGKKIAEEDLLKFYISYVYKLKNSESNNIKSFRKLLHAILVLIDSIMCANYNRGTSVNSELIDTIGLLMKELNQYLQDKCDVTPDAYQPILMEFVSIYKEIVLEYEYSFSIPNPPVLIPKDDGNFEFAINGVTDGKIDEVVTTDYTNGTGEVTREVVGTDDSRDSENVVEVNNSEEYLRRIRTLEERVEGLDTKLSEALKKLQKAEKDLKSCNGKLARRDEKLANVPNITKEDLAELRSKCKEYKKAKEELEREKDSLQEQITELGNSNETLTSKITELDTRIGELGLANASLESQLAGFQSLVETHEQTISALESEKAELLVSAEEYRKLKLSIETKNARKEYLKKIKQTILQLLSFTGFTFEQLKANLTSRGTIVTDRELEKLLKEINEEVSIIDNRNISFPRVYQVKSHDVVTNGIITIDTNGADSIDLLFDADWHIDRGNKVLIYKKNMELDYATKHGIRYIFGLGDLITLSNEEEDTMNPGELRKKVVQLTYDLADMLPSDSSVQYLNLGGNHERKIVDFGIDPLDLLSNLRNDQTCIGYEHAALRWTQNTTDQIGLHHFGKVSWTNDSLLNNQRIVSALLGYYTNNNFGTYQPYIDMLAHFHGTCIDSKNAYCLIPSFTRDDNLVDEYGSEKGAWHLKIYFNADRTIKGIVFIPLRIDNVLKQSPATYYEKPVKLIK